MEISGCAYIFRIIYAYIYIHTHTFHLMIIEKNHDLKESKRWATWEGL